MASKRKPLCNSLAFWGPTRGPPQRGPQGEMRPQRPCPSRGGSRGRPRRTPTTGPRGPAKGEQPLLEDGVVRKMRAVQPLGSAWVESGASRCRGVRYGLKVELLAAAGFDMGREGKGEGGGEPRKSRKRHTISRRTSSLGVSSAAVVGALVTRAQRRGGDRNANYPRQK